MIFPRTTAIILMVSLAASSGAKYNNEEASKGLDIGMRLQQTGGCAEAVFRRCSALLEAMYRLPLADLRGLAGIQRFCDTEQAYMQCVAQARHCRSDEMRAVKQLVVGLSMVVTHPYCPNMDYSSVLQHTGEMSVQCTSLDMEMCLVHELTSSGSTWSHCTTRPMSLKCFMGRCLGIPSPSQLTAAKMMAKVMQETFKEDTCQLEEQDPASDDMSYLYEG